MIIFLLLEFIPELKRSIPGDKSVINLNNAYNSKIKKAEITPGFNLKYFTNYYSVVVAFDSCLASTESVNTYDCVVAVDPSVGLVVNVSDFVDCFA